MGSDRLDESQLELHEDDPVRETLSPSRLLVVTI